MDRDDAQYFMLYRETANSANLYYNYGSGRLISGFSIYTFSKPALDRSAQTVMKYLFPIYISTLTVRFQIYGEYPFVDILAHI